MLSHQAIAQKLPDIPRWVEARALLLLGHGEIFGLQEQPELACVIREPGAGAVFIVGTPALSAVRDAVKAAKPGAEAITTEEQGSWLAQALPGWTRSRVIVHQLFDAHRLPTTTAGRVEFLEPAALAQLTLPDDLRQELEEGAEHSPIAAARVNGQPVSFCYAGSITESLWDISIDTLPEHRRKGYATLCVAHMVQHMQAQGKQPVWQAEASNPASWRLAQKLGFVAVDELTLFKAGAA